jgi:hypothetical protein
MLGLDYVDEPNIDNLFECSLMNYQRTVRTFAPGVESTHTAK